MRSTRYFVVILAGLALSGCGDPTLDPAHIEDELAPQVAEQTGTKDVEISCPDDIEAKKGDEFDCEVTAPGGLEATVTVVQQNDDGDVSWDPKSLSREAP